MREFWKPSLSFAAILMLAFMFMPLSAVQAGQYAVIVNKNNKFSGSASKMKAQVKRLYLKQQKSWPSGTKAIPFGAKRNSAAEKAFMAKVLGMSKSSIESHWLKLKQTRGDTPPRGIGSARILGRQVGRKPGAFGIVKTSRLSAMPGNVRKLFEFD